MLVLPPPQPRNIPAQAIAKKIAAMNIAREIPFSLLLRAIGLRRNIASSLTAPGLLAKGRIASNRAFERGPAPSTLSIRIAPQARLGTCPNGQFSSSRIICL